MRRNNTAARARIFHGAIENKVGLPLGSIATLSMSLSSVSLVSNALRLMLLSSNVQGIVHVGWAGWLSRFVCIFANKMKISLQ